MGDQEGGLLEGGHQHVGQFGDGMIVDAGRVFTPRPEASAAYARTYANWRETYERLKTLYPRLGADDPSTV